MTLIERLKYRLAALWAAVTGGYSLTAAWRMPLIAGGDGTEPGTEPPAPEDEPNGDEKEPFDLDRAKKKINAVNQEAAALRKRAQEAEAKVQQFEDRNKTETEKLSEQAEADRKNAATAAQEAARLRVALRKGLTETQAKRLVGVTEEELAADADQLLEDFKGQEPDPKPKPVSTRPVETLRPGAVPDARASDNELTGTARLAAAYKAKE